MTTFEIILAAIEIASNQILSAVILAIPPTIVAIAGFVTLIRGQRQMHIIMNSRLTELIAANKKASHSEGREDERDHTAHKQPCEHVCTIDIDAVNF